MSMIKKLSLFILVLFASLCMVSCGGSDYDENDIYNRTFTVKFVNWDGTLLYETSVKYGENATYNGPTPTKEGNEIENYEFWYFSDYEYIKKDTTCVAVYKTVLNVNSEYYTNVRCGFKKYGNGYKITDCYGTTYLDDENLKRKKIVLPTMYDGLPVIAIGDDAFYEEFSRYTSIVFPKYLEEIGDYAFYDANFTSIVTPSTLKSIGAKAFASMHDLQSITLNEGLESIGDRAFEYSNGYLRYHNRSINITIPSTVTSMGSNVFYSGDEELSFNIYCSPSSRPSGWDKEWHLNSGFGGQWESYYHKVYWNS